MEKQKLKVIKRTLRRPFEWLGMGLGLLVFSNLPRRWMLSVCDFVSAVMCRFYDKGRRRYLASLRVIRGKIKLDGIVRPVKVYNPAAAEAKIIRRSYRNMARTMTQRCIRDLERVIRRHLSAWVLNYRNFRKWPDEKEMAAISLDN